MNILSQFSPLWKRMSFFLRQLGQYQKLAHTLNQTTSQSLINWSLSKTLIHSVAICCHRHPTTRMSMCFTWHDYILTDIFLDACGKQILHYILIHLALKKSQMKESLMKTTFNSIILSWRWKFNSKIILHLCLYVLLIILIIYKYVPLSNLDN